MLQITACSVFPSCFLLHAMMVLVLSPYRIAVQYPLHKSSKQFGISFSNFEIRDNLHIATGSRDKTAQIKNLGDENEIVLSYEHAIFNIAYFEVTLADLLGNSCYYHYFECKIIY